MSVHVLFENWYLLGMGRTWEKLPNLLSKKKHKNSKPQPESKI